MQDDYRSKIYNNYADRYSDGDVNFDEKGAARWGKAYDYYFKGWLPEDKEASIGEIACGRGWLLRFLRERGYSNLIGVDISPSQIRLSRQAINNVREMDVIQFLEENMTAFDLIVGMDIIEHFKKSEVLRLLDGCRSALKPNGRLILQTPNAESPWFGTVRYNDLTHEICFGTVEMVRILESCGFINVEIREQGPVPLGYSIFSTMRFLLWQIIRINMKLWNLVETGSPGSGVFSRVFLVSCTKS